MDHNFFLAKEQPLGNIEGQGPLGTGLISSNVGPAASMFANVLSLIIGVMTIIAFIWFLITLFIGAVSWLGSGGDKTKLQSAQKQIATGLVGLVIVVGAIFFVKLIGTILGIDILSVQKLITNLWQ